MPDGTDARKLSIEQVAEHLQNPMKPGEIIEKLSDEGYTEKVIRQTIRKGFDEGKINLDDEMQLVTA